MLKEIKEGEIYVISNFKVKDYLGDEKYRVVRSKKHIFFTPHTLFKKATDVGLPIELYAFDLFHYDAIEKLADDNRFLIGNTFSESHIHTKICQPYLVTKPFLSRYGWQGDKCARPNQNQKK